MTSIPFDYLVETFPDAPVSLEDPGLSSYDVIVEYGNVEVEGLSAQQPEIVEIFTEPPVGGGYYRTEVLAFTKQGALATLTGTAATEFPISGGSFVLESVAARVVTAPTGAAVILDILKNNASIFTVPGDRPTIASGANTAITTLPAGIMFADGDFLEVNIVQVGSSTPGTTLTASVRLTRIG